MEKPTQQPEVKRSAANILSRHFGYDIEVGSPECLTEPERRNTLWRLSLKTSSKGVPASVVIKQRSPDLYKPETPSEPGTREFFNDWAGLAFLEQLTQGQAPLAPRFYGGDKTLGMIVLEDLGDKLIPVEINGEVSDESSSLVQPLLGSDSGVATGFLEQMMRLLGRMHALSAKQLAAYRTLRQELDPDWTEAQDISARLRPLDNLVECANDLNLPLPLEVQEELKILKRRLEQPGPWLVYGHGDPCPDNLLEVDGKLRLIDFEFGGLQYALLDASYAHLPFPSCWCWSTLPPNVVQRLENAYREEAAKGIPEVADDKLFYLALADVIAFWVLSSFQWRNMVKDEDRPWGLSTLRTRMLHRLALLSNHEHVKNAYPNMAAYTEHSLGVLGERWGELATPIYTAFSKGAK